MCLQATGAAVDLPCLLILPSTQTRGERRCTFQQQANTTHTQIQMGYGDAGAPPSIPGQATLIFETELVKIE